MSYRVSIENFEGPFDLLLYLVNRQKVDIGAISISEIADQYLVEVSKMKDLDLDVASDFLLVAARLLEIKAASLVELERSEEDEEFQEISALEARDMLIHRLLEYKKYKNASAMLLRRYIAEERMCARTYGPDPEFYSLTPDYLEGVSVSSLASLCVEALARRDVFLLESDHIAAKVLPVEVHAQAIHQRIAQKGKLRFSELVGTTDSTQVIVVNFLAILELYKRSKVSLLQNETFGDIVISYIEDENSPDFEEALNTTLEQKIEVRPR